MYILDTLNEISYYRVGLIFKYIVNIVFTAVPIMIMILCMTDIAKAIHKPDELKTQIKQATDRIIAGLIIFIIPSIINYGMTLVNGYDNNTILKYYDGASKEKINQLQKQYEAEVKAKANLEAAQYKEDSAKVMNQEAKRREQAEEIFDRWKESQNPTTSNNNYSSGGNSNGGSSNNTSTTPYTGDSQSSGSFGGVTVNNGVFTIPNRRATSDADTPKQSGNYGLNPIFWERLNKFIQAAAQRGYKITVTNGWRSYSSQRRLWDNSNRSCSERSKWVACPGGSRHGFGIAADLKYNGSSCSQGSWNCNAAAKWAHENAASFGLKYRMSWEPWHIEPAQVNGGSFGKCTAKC